MRRRLSWILGLTVAMSLVGYLAWALAQPSPTVFLPGRTSDGHHQIEEACASCHTPLGGVEQKACLRCHGAELEVAHDSHPPSKFTDPRNAERAARLDAAHCVTCHREHRPEHTRPMGATLQDDFCFTCHQDISGERSTHAGLAFSTCASAACHNFHDNRALYEDLLVRSAGEPRTFADARVLARPPVARAAEARAPQVDAPAAHRDPEIERAWRASRHAAAEVGCQSCHAGEQAGSAAGERAWIERPDHSACARCHEGEQAGFLGGKHGMRLGAGLGAMRPGLARLPMRAEATNRKLGCGSCHDPHGTDTRAAAVEACEGCHDDAHTRAFRGSPHFALWEREGTAPAELVGTGVSCASCHLPRAPHEGRVRVEHNQNANLRPNEKMAREVCGRCHGLPFALAALADPAQVARNFRGAPGADVESIRMALSRKSERGGPKEKRERSEP